MYMVFRLPLLKDENRTSIVVLVISLRNQVDVPHCLAVWDNEHFTGIIIIIITIIISSGL